MRTLDGSPSLDFTSPSALVSFSFLQKIPVQDFIETEHSKAQKWIEKHKMRLHRDVEDEMMRKIE